MGLTTREIHKNTQACLNVWTLEFRHVTTYNKDEGDIHFKIHSSNIRRHDNFNTFHFSASMWGYNCAQIRLKGKEKSLDRLWTLKTKV